ncbi:putative CCA tRNA nucleotidyltransferase [Helianthus anomalus]
MVRLFTGFEAYLVGGCVRDLLLNSPAKDFDVITTADLNLNAYKGISYRGTLYSLLNFCMLYTRSPALRRWLKILKKNKNLSYLKCLEAVTSLYLISGKTLCIVTSLLTGILCMLRTLVPAHVSFTEDCARILQGLRIAARLGLSFSKDIESAIHKHASSILSLSTFRIMMEINYMLSYGAAESSLRLLHRFHILKYFATNSGNL